MVSIEGELVPLATRITPAAANGAVEKWLVQVGVRRLGGDWGTVGLCRIQLSAVVGGRG